MPRTNVDYSKTVMYKFVCNDLHVTDTYVGHTTNFVKRKSGHKQSCHNENDKSHNLKIYKIIRENGGWDAWQMIEIEKYSCADDNEATTRERYWYEQLNGTMNTLNPHRSQAERWIINAGYSAQRKEYRKENKDKISEKKKITCICECGSTIRFEDKARHNRSRIHISFLDFIK